MGAKILIRRAAQPADRGLAPRSDHGTVYQPLLDSAGFTAMVKFGGYR